MNNEFLIEGYPLVSNGIVYLVKGYQHPPGMVIAYPRYNLLLYSKIKWLKNKYVNMYYWDCIKLHVPVISLDRVFQYDFKHISNSQVLEIISFLKKLLSIDENNIILTGSSLINEGSNDVDVIIRGASEEVVDELVKHIRNNVLSRVSEYTLIREYFNKHKSYTDLRTYLYLKNNTILHINYKGIHVNLKLLRYRIGYNYCKDPVYSRRFFEGTIEVVKPIRRIVLPAKFLVKIGDEYMVLETQREILSELRSGKYYVRGEVEERRDGRVLCIDRGFIYLVK
jgi:predicted nucleotidyltransferase